MIGAARKYVVLIGAGLVVLLAIVFARLLPNEPREEPPPPPPAPSAGAPEKTEQEKFAEFEAYVHEQLSKLTPEEWAELQRREEEFQRYLEEQNAKRTPEEQAELDRREEEFRLYVEEYYRNNQQ